jgi:hypothetical protein
MILDMRSAFEVLLLIALYPHSKVQAKVEGYKAILVNYDVNKYAVLSLPCITQTSRQRIDTTDEWIFNGKTTVFICSFFLSGTF